MPAKPILISGAGLGGLLLARSLRSKNIPFLVYERDPAGSSRTQGYRIRLSNQGLTALSSVLSPENYAAFRNGCSDNGSGEIHSYDAISMTERKRDFNNGSPKSGGQVLGVSRGFLRESLFEGIEDVVRFNKNVTGYEATPSGVMALFADGSKSEEGSLLVGADGVRSRITSQLTEGRLKVYDTGARMIHGSSPRRTFDQLAQGRFAAFAVEDEENAAGRISMITNVRDEPGPDVHFGWVLVGGPGSFSAPKDDFSISGQPAVDISVSLTSSWSDKLRPILTEQSIPDAAFLKMSTSSPEGVPEWTNQPRVTLLGDAVHAMTPAGGVGANTALRDAELLGRLIGKNGGWGEDVTGEYEKEMRVYASENVKDSFATASKRFAITELSKTI